MSATRLFLTASGIIIGATIGAGIFALPYSFGRAGWLAGGAYLLVLGAVVVFAHILYWRVLQDRVGQGLLGLVRETLGPATARLGFVAIIVGLVLTLTAYLVLAGQFVQLVFPGVSFAWSMGIFWLAGTAPLVLKMRRLITIEVLGTLFIIIIVLLILFSATSTAASVAPWRASDFFLPFAPVLFSLAGWTAVEPIRAWRQKFVGIKFYPIAILIVGTAAVLILYAGFVRGVFLSADIITPDTISGLVGWSAAKMAALGSLGLLAIWTSYVPIGLEVKNSLARDMGWGPAVGTLTVTVLPPLLVVAGLNNFLQAVGLAGGVFLSAQYLLILLVARRILRLSRVGRLTTAIAAVTFVVAATYEVYFFFA